MAESGRASYASQPGRRSLRALWHAAFRQIASRTNLAGAQAAAVFGLLLLLQLFVGVLTPLGISLGTWWDYVHAAIMGATLAPPTLLALWAVFGPQRLAVRLPLSLWLTTVCYLAVAYGEKRNNGQATTGLDFGSAWLLAFVITQLPLWLLRAVRRWRLTAAVAGAEAAALDAHERGGTKSLQTSQFTLRALLGWMLAAATSLAALRCLSPATDFDLNELPSLLSEAGFIGPMVALAGLPIVPLAWIILADGRRLILRTVLCLLTLVGMAIGLGVFWHLEDAETARWLAVIEAGALLDGLVALGVVRACGYRLRRRAKRTDETATIQSQVVRRPLSRWRFAIAAAPMVAIALVLAGSLPDRFALWRRADVATQWRERGVHIVYDDDGRITSAQCRSKSLSDDELRSIVGLADLESLDLGGTPLDRRQLALLAPLTGLRSLTLSHTRVTDSDLAFLTRFPQLSFLDLTATAVTDAGMEHLTRIRRLQALHLNLTDVTDRGYSTLAAMPQLKVIEANLTAVTQSGIDRCPMKCPNAQISIGATDALLARLIFVREELYEKQTMSGTRIGVSKRSVKLRRLHAGGRVVANGVKFVITDAGLAFLDDQTELEELDLRESGVTDQGLTALSKLKSLSQNARGAQGDIGKL